MINFPPGSTWLASRGSLTNLTCVCFTMLGEYCQRTSSAHIMWTCPGRMSSTMTCRGVLQADQVYQLVCLMSKYSQRRDQLHPDLDLLEEADHSSNTWAWICLTMYSCLGELSSITTAWMDVNALKLKLQVRCIVSHDKL